MNTAKLFGGPGHGRVVDADKSRFLCQFSPVPERPDLLRQIPDHRPHDEFVYFVHRYGISRNEPRGYKEASIGILEGAELTRYEQMELEDHVRRLPWILDRASILEDFDQWFAEARYRVVGDLWWRDSPASPR